MTQQKYLEGNVAPVSLIERSPNFGVLSPAYDLVETVPLTEDGSCA
jgi:hypothetical protein